MNKFESTNDHENDNLKKIRELLISKDNIIKSADPIDPEKFKKIPRAYRDLPNKIINSFNLEDKMPRAMIVQMMIFHALEEERIPMEEENERKARINTIINNLIKGEVLIEENGDLRLAI